ncbi:unnamed protein product [Calicophoron daubneyi]|uniref:Endothelin-converting enzyme 1 n=1 Tax=Calicophoron daubneyi TaxID=300641 RepID=A0AAV2TR47_CALDB
MGDRSQRFGTGTNIKVTNRDGNCISEDCIPFSQVRGSGGADTEGLQEEGGDKGNGGNPSVWILPNHGVPFFKRTPSFWSRLLLVLLLLLLALLIIFVTLWIIQRKRLEAAPCLDPSCIIAAAEILSNMDPSLSPCDGFYEYACNGWIRNHHIPQGHNTWSILRKLTKDGEYFTKDLMENRTIPNPSRGLRLAQVYYKSCMNDTWINQRGFDPLYKSIQSLFDGWLLLPPGSKGARTDGGAFLTRENFNLTAMYLPSFKYFGGFPLFRIGVGQDQRNSSKFVIDISEGIVSLHRENYINESYSLHAKQTMAFKNFMRNYSIILGVPRSQVNELDKVYEFEKAIASRTEERSERDPEKNYELITLSNLTTICPVLEWKTMISEVFRPLNYTISDDQIIALNDRDFFKDRCKLYAEYLQNDTGIRVLHNAAVWGFLWKTASRMPKSVSQALEEYREAEYGFKVDPPRWQTCVAEIHHAFGIVVGRYFVNERFDKKSKEVASEMINEIRQAFKENFATVDWMQEADKQKAIQKVDAMKASVGYPENINDLAEENMVYESVERMSELTYFENSLVCAETVTLDQLRLLLTKDRDKWDLSPHIVNAFYKENANHIFFPAGILQSPVYNYNHPMSVNFGGIGMVVGHEITHAFDQYGSKRDSEGNLRQWWSNKTREAFELNSQCMIDQYSNYSILNTSLNGKMTLGENIADNGGIKAAYKAFKKLEARHKDIPTLPGLNFTPDQLFFISFAQIWCVKNLPQSVMNTVLFDVHTVDQYRVIGTLSNSEDFARVFNCPVGSLMNPAKKCAVW